MIILFVYVKNLKTLNIIIKLIYSFYWINDEFSLTSYYELKLKEIKSKIVYKNIHN